MRRTATRPWHRKTTIILSGLAIIAIIMLSASCSPANHMGVGVRRTPSGVIVAMSFPCEGAPLRRLTFIEVGPPWREALTTAPVDGSFGHATIQVGSYRPGWTTRILAPWELSIHGRYEIADRRYSRGM